MASTVCNLTVEEQKREALGRWLALVSTVIGIAGTGILLSVNPNVKTTAGAVLDRLPEPLRKHKGAVIVGVVGLAALVVGGIIVRRIAKNKAQG